MRDLLRLAAVAGLALSLAGCIAGETASWSDAGGTPPESRQGVLFKLNIDAELRGNFTFGHDVYFLRPDDPPDEMSMGYLVHHSQFYGVPSRWSTAGKYHANRFPDDLVLVPLKPGHYKGIDVEVWHLPTARGVASRSLHVAAPGPMDSFDVRPGKLTVLGTMDVKLEIVPGSATSSAEAVTSDAERLEILDEALSRPEAQSRGWAGLLGAARGELARPIVN